MKDVITIKSSGSSSSEYMKRLFAIFMTENWLWFLLPVVVLLSLSLVNLKFILVALMVLFVVFPMVLMFLYFNYALTDEARLSISKTNIKLKDEVLSINRLFISDDNSCNLQQKDYINKVLEERDYSWKDLKGMLVGKWGIALRYKKRYWLLLIPDAAFGDDNQRSLCINFIKEQMNK